MTFAPTREIQEKRESLLERGWDFGFEHFFPGGLFGGLPEQAAVIVESIWNSGSEYTVIDENTTWEEYEEQFPEYFEPILETRPGRVADSYPQDVAESEHEEDDEVAHTWGHLAREFVGDWLNPAPVSTQPINFVPNATVPPQVGVTSPSLGGGAGCDGMAWSGGVPPKGYKVVNYCGQGVLRKIRRRRRRRMLTASDASDLATIVGIVGKGQMASSMINRTRS